MSNKPKVTHGLNDFTRNRGASDEIPHCDDLASIYNRFLVRVQE